MELSIDTTSEAASIALSDEGTVVVENTWRCRSNHTVELLPAIDKLVAGAGATKLDLRALFVCTGPGMYTGLRVGISIAQGFARGLGLPALGVGRLELDAYPHAAFPGTIIAVHRAGRGELAWAAYMSSDSGGWREIAAPRLSTPESLAGAIRDRALVAGEVDEELATLLTGSCGDRVVIAPETESRGRARTLATLGYVRLAADESSEPALLRPIYLRPPAIEPKHRPVN